jgi:hypothetical protein
MSGMLRVVLQLVRRSLGKNQQAENKGRLHHSCCPSLPSAFGQNTKVTLLKASG